MVQPLGKRVVLLRGADFRIQVEHGVATAVIKPGYLVDGINSVAPHATAGGVAPKSIALERDELGKGIDSTWTSPYSSAGSPDYAIGDQVKVANCHSGMEFTGWIPSGQNITENDRMESNGDGTFRKFAAGSIIARATETLDARNLVGPVKIKLQFM